MISSHHNGFNMLRFGSHVFEDFSIFDGMWVLVWASLALCETPAFPISSTQQYDHLLVNSSTVEYATPLSTSQAISERVSEEGLGSSSTPETTEAPTTEELNTSVAPLTNSSDVKLMELNCSETNEKYRADEDVGLGTWPIVGICLALIALAAIIGSVSLILYRHSMWNRPQTLSDKCSNDESTGYIDDSAFRENSEELYSLDNDSFLNSLEAMTIQNYWTDHVKHTKL